MPPEIDNTPVQAPAWLRNLVVAVFFIVSSTVTVVVYASSLKSEIQQLKVHQIDQDKNADETRQDMKEITRQLGDIKGAINRVEGKVDQLHR